MWIHERKYEIEISFTLQPAFGAKLFTAHLGMKNNRGAFQHDTS